MNKMTETTNNELADRVFELLAEGWPLRSMTLLELVTITGHPEEEVLAVLNQDPCRIRRCCYSYGTVYQSRDEIARRALAYIDGHDWCCEHEIKMVVGAFDGVHSTLESLAEVGVLSGHDTRDGTLWHIPEDRAAAMCKSSWTDPAINVRNLKERCMKFLSDREARVYI